MKQTQTELRLIDHIMAMPQPIKFFRNYVRRRSRPSRLTREFLDDLDKAIVWLSDERGKVRNILSKYDIPYLVSAAKSMPDVQRNRSEVERRLTRLDAAIIDIGDLRRQLIGDKPSIPLDIALREMKRIMLAVTAPI